MLLENTVQIQNVIKMAHPKFSANGDKINEVSSAKGAAPGSSALERLEYEFIAAGLSMSPDEKSTMTHYKFLHSAQSLMSGAASSYKLSMLYSGTLTAAFACFVSAVVAFYTSPTSRYSPLDATWRYDVC